jgi:serine/threonine protein kinase
LAATPEDVFVIGRIIDNYEIRSLLGEGEVGSVYLCEHTFITRRVAIKVLRRAFSQDEAKVARFMGDARAANNLGHPEIAHIVDMGRLAPEVGQSEDGAAGLPYVMREWLDGETLAQRIGRLGKVPLYEAVGIAKQACAALIATHAAGIVHGDLKPENFLLGDGLRGARLKLLDFGIAHLRDAAAPLDVRADVRALGAILQAMLAGPSPNPDLPRWMERIIERADGQEPETRFETMAALAAALDDGPHVRVTAEARAAAIAAPAGESGPAMTPTPLPGMTPPATDLGDVSVGDVSVGDVSVGDVSVGDVSVGDASVGDPW